MKFAEEETHKVDLSSLSNKLLPGLTTLGFKDDRRQKGTPKPACLLWRAIHAEASSLLVQNTQNCFCVGFRSHVPQQCLQRPDPSKQLGLS